MTKSRYRKWLIPVFYFWLITLYVLTAIPGSNGPEKFSDSPVRWDYLEHLFLFMLIPILYFLSGGAGMKIKTLRAGILLICAGLFYAVVAEVQQIWVPGRAFNPVDLTLNLTGFLTGIPAGIFASRIIFRKRLKNGQRADI